MWVGAVIKICSMASGMLEVGRSNGRDMFCGASMALLLKSDLINNSQLNEALSFVSALRQ